VAGDFELNSPEDVEPRKSPPIDAEPRLSFSPIAWQKLALYTTLCEVEISGLGLIDVVADGYRLRDLLLVDQEADTLAARLSGDAVSDLIVRLVTAGEDPEGLRLWWHSHAREAVFWSGDDEETISGFQNEGMISLVSNHSMRLLARLDHYGPRATAFVWVEPPVDPPAPGASEIAAAKADIDRHVRRVSIPMRTRSEG
jgi:hypothetical protein